MILISHVQISIIPILLDLRPRYKLSLFVVIQIISQIQPQVKLRIGLATGPVSVGMIGMKIPKYCVFGETVTLATAMEERSQGQFPKISLYL